jgi:predicted metal-dependent hydrolase
MTGWTVVLPDGKLIKSMFRKFPRRRKLIGEYKIRIDGKDLHYILKQSLRTRYVRLEIWPDQTLVVIVPGRYDMKYVNQFIRSKREWIYKKLAQQSRVKKVDGDRELGDKDIIRFLGSPVTITLVSGNIKSDRVSLEQGRLLVNPDGSDKTIDSLVEDWYRFQAKLLINEKIETFSRQMGLEYKGFSIRGQRTRWGSCSRKKILSFNWKLMKAPETIIDYVVIHELAHLKEMNHSSKFWDLVGKYYPEYKKIRLWLRKNQDLLVSF